VIEGGSHRHRDSNSAHRAHRGKRKGGYGVRHGEAKGRAKAVFASTARPGCARRSSEKTLKLTPVMGAFDAMDSVFVPKSGGGFGFGLQCPQAPEPPIRSSLGPRGYKKAPGNHKTESQKEGQWGASQG